MDYLWTPWRYRYVSTAGQPADECLFCVASHDHRDRELLVVHRGESCFIVLNRYPYNSGHVMIAPHRHIGLLEEATEVEMDELIRLSAQSQKALRSEYEAEGFNLGMNLGRCAGAGVAGHIHMHLLPRWNGDANFMSVVGETRVLPEALDVTLARLQKFF